VSSRVPVPCTRENAPLRAEDLHEAVPGASRLGGDLHASLDGVVMGDHLVHHAPLQDRLRVDLLAGPGQPLGAGPSRDLLPDDLHAVAAGDAESCRWHSRT
jgi:hypothetical protein